VQAHISNRCDTISKLAYFQEDWNVINFIIALLSLLYLLLILKSIRSSISIYHRVRRAYTHQQHTVDPDAPIWT